MVIKTSHLKWGGAALLSIIIASCSTTIVNKGHTAGETVFGKVNMGTTYSEGFHFVNPLARITQMTTRDESILLRGIDVSSEGRATANGLWIIQTADKMSTGVNVEILIQINPTSVPMLIQQASTFEGVVNKYVHPALTEALYKQGSSIATAQDLFTPEAKVKLKDGVISDMRSYISNQEIMGELANSITIKDVKVQRLALPEQIERLIMETKEREEAEEIAKSNERRRQTDARAGLYEKQQSAEALKAEAEAESYRRMQNAEALEREAEAKLVAATKEAQGIAAMNAQLTTRYIDYVHAQASLIASQNYKGETPAQLTILSDTSTTVPFLKVGNK